VSPFHPSPHKGVAICRYPPTRGPSFAHSVWINTIPSLSVLLPVRLLGSSLFETLPMPAREVHSALPLCHFSPYGRLSSPFVLASRFLPYNIVFPEAVLRRPFLLLTFFFTPLAIDFFLRRLASLFSMENLPPCRYRFN